MASTELHFDDASCTEAIQNIRSNNHSSNWVLFTYSETGRNTITFACTGEGGLEELKSHLVENKIFYGLLRVEDKIDESVTVKFVFITWCGERVPYTLKGRMATHKGSIVSLIGQFHNDWSASNLSEIAYDDVMNKVMDASGTRSRVKKVSEQSSPVVSHTQTTQSNFTVQTVQPVQTSNKGSGYVPAGARKPTVVGTPNTKVEIGFHDFEALKAAIGDVRSDASETNWCLFNYVDNNILGLQAKGTNGLAELRQYFENDKILYAFLRLTEAFETTTTVKFIAIFWIGEKIPVARKARIATHKGAVLELFGQFHTDVNASTLDEVTEEIVVQKIGDASGSGNRVIHKSDDGTVVRKGSSYRPAGAVGRTSGTGSLKFADENGSRALISAIRSDADPTNWVLFGYEGSSNSIVSVGSGTGGAGELINHLSTDAILYGLIRTTLVFDESVTVKFVLVLWVGEGVPTIRKARITTHKGDVTAFIGQYHVDVSASNLSEISEEIIHRLVTVAAGTAIHVKP
eukprot:TRINITY_DN1475_c0_g2_i1.p1 TRINITY_DN1475_c0_g2~~TRINITY_DN1475_c0_g2_i1.p1  ORF type:complete len:517 (-),score=270.75 TRINITY_DN1475_c0_g2_i1:94-1644(-)